MTDGINPAHRQALQDRFRRTKPLNQGGDGSEGRRPTAVKETGHGLQEWSGQVVGPYRQLRASQQQRLHRLSNPEFGKGVHDHQASQPVGMPQGEVDSNRAPIGDADHHDSDDAKVVQ